MKEYSSKEFAIKLEDGIVHVLFRVEFVNYVHVDTGIKKRLEITEGKTYPMLSDITAVKGSTSEAKKRMAEIDASTGISALAIIYKMKLHLILFKAFSLIYKPPVKTKLFKNKAHALKWLEQYKNN